MHTCIHTHTIKIQSCIIKRNQFTVIVYHQSTRKKKKNVIHSFKVDSRYTDTKPNMVLPSMDHINTLCQYALLRTFWLDLVLFSSALYTFTESVLVLGRFSIIRCPGSYRIDITNGRIYSSSRSVFARRRGCRHSSQKPCPDSDTPVVVGETVGALTTNPKKEDVSHHA